jgi:hypothetical protein
MHKRLAILALLVLTCRGCSQVPRDGSHQDQKTQQGQSHASVSQPVPSSTTNSQQTAAEQEHDSNAKSRGYPWRELYGPANIPAWCLVLVGIWASGMAYWTLRHIENQTEQLRIQATLMREQMDRMVHKDQARLNLDPQPVTIEGTEGFFYLSASIELKNLGESKNLFKNYACLRKNR